MGEERGGRETTETRRGKVTREPQRQTSYSAGIELLLHAAHRILRKKIVKRVKAVVEYRATSPANLAT